MQEKRKDLRLFLYNQRNSLNYEEKQHEKKAKHHRQVDTTKVSRL